MSDDKNLEVDRLLPRLDDGDGPMPPLSEPAANALTWRVVERWSSGAAPARDLTPAEAQSVVQRAVRRHARRQLWRAVAAASFVLGVSGVALGALRVFGPLQPDPAPPAAEQARPSRASPKPTRATAAPASPASTASAPTPAPAVTPSAATPEPPAATSGWPVAPVPSLARANALRAAREWQQARNSYLEIAAAAPKPRARYVAAVAAAALCLQHTAEPERALQLYTGALRAWPAGDLSEEIRLGRAQALRALELAGDEAVALRDFLDHHPDSAYAEAARARLGQLTP